MYKFGCFLIFCLIPFSGICQTKFSLGLHLNPISNKIIPPDLGQFNNPSDANNYGLFQIDETYNGIKTGIDLDMLFNNDFGIKLNPSFLSQGFNFTQNSFPGIKNGYGIIRTNVRYAGLELPLLAYKNVPIIEDKTSLKLMAGLSLDMKKYVGATTTYDLIDTGGYLYLETMINSTPSSVTGGSGILGVSFFQKMKTYGAIELGFSYHYSLMEMPLYNYSFIWNDVQFSSQLHPRINYVGYNITYFFGKNN